MCLVLIGYDEDLLDPDLVSDLPVDTIRFVRGGHAMGGRPKETLDTEALERAARLSGETTGVFAVSAHGATVNPEHERLARSVIEQVSGRPVVCASDADTRVDCFARAATAAVNARLLSTAQTIAEACDGAGFSGPVSYIDGRGRLRAALELTADPGAFVLSAAAARREEVARRCSPGSVHVDVHDTYVAVSRIGADSVAEDPSWETTVLPVGLDTRVVGDGRGGCQLSSDCVRPLAAAFRQQLPTDFVFPRSWESSYPGTGDAFPSVFIAGAAAVGVQELTASEFHILKKLARGPTSRSELARSLEMSDPVLASLTNRLRRAGLIECVAATLGDLIKRPLMLPNGKARRALADASAHLADLLSPEIGRRAGPADTVVLTGAQDGSACLSKALERTTSLRVNAPDSSASFGARGVLRIRGQQ